MNIDYKNALKKIKDSFAPKINKIKENIEKEKLLFRHIHDFEKYTNYLTKYIAYTVGDMKNSTVTNNADILFLLALVVIINNSENREFWPIIQEIVEPIINEEYKKHSYDKTFKLTQNYRDKIKGKVNETINFFKLIGKDNRDEYIDELLKMQCFVTKNNIKDFFKFIQFFYRKNIIEEKRRFNDKEDLKDIIKAAKDNINKDDDLGRSDVTVDNAMTRYLRTSTRKVIASNIPVVEKLLKTYIEIYQKCCTDYNNIQKFIEETPSKCYLKYCYEWCKENIPALERGYNNNHKTGIRNTHPAIVYDDDKFYLSIPELTLSGNMNLIKIQVKQAGKDLIEPICLNRFTKRVGRVKTDYKAKIAELTNIFERIDINIFDENENIVYDYFIPKQKFRFFKWNDDQKNIYGEYIETDKLYDTTSCGECILVTQKDIKVEVKEEVKEEDLIDENTSSELFNYYKIDIRKDVTIDIDNKTHYAVQPETKNQKPYDICYYPTEINYKVFNTELKKCIDISYRHPIICIYKNVSEFLSGQRELWLEMSEEKGIEDESELKPIKISVDGNTKIKTDETDKEFIEIDLNKEIEELETGLSAQFTKKQHKYILTAKKHGINIYETICEYLLINDYKIELSVYIYTSEDVATIFSSEYLQGYSGNAKREKISNNKYKYTCEIKDINSKVQFKTDLAYFDKKIEEDKEENYYVLEVPFKLLTYSLDAYGSELTWKRIEPNSYIIEKRIGDYICIKFNTEDIKKPRMYFKAENNEEIELPHEKISNEDFHRFSTFNLTNAYDDNKNICFYGSVWLNFQINKKEYSNELFKITNKPIVSKIQFDETCENLYINYTKISEYTMYCRIKENDTIISEEEITTEKIPIPYKNNEIFSLVIFAKDKDGAQTPVKSFPRVQRKTKSNIFKRKNINIVGIKDEYEIIKTCNNHVIKNILQDEDEKYKGDLFIYPLKQPVKVQIKYIDNNTINISSEDTELSYYYKADNKINLHPDDRFHPINDKMNFKIEIHDEDEEE